MTLIEHCDPLFQYVCRLNRLSRSGKSLGYETVRGDLVQLLEKLVQQAQADPRLHAQMEKVELPLIFFVDSMIAESPLGFAAQWHQNRLAFERKELAGDEKFFDLLEETLSDPSEDAAERLAVFYTCMGLGFVGMYNGSPDKISRYMSRIVQRVHRSLETDPSARLCPEAYTDVDDRDLTLPPASRMAWVGIVFLICSLSVVASYIWMFHGEARSMTSSLTQILRLDKP